MWLLRGPRFAAALPATAACVTSLWGPRRSLSLAVLQGPARAPTRSQTPPPRPCCLGAAVGAAPLVSADGRSAAALSLTSAKCPAGQRRTPPRCPVADAGTPRDEQHVPGTRAPSPRGDASSPPCCACGASALPPVLARALGEGGRGLNFFLGRVTGRGSEPPGPLPHCIYIYIYPPCTIYIYILGPYQARDMGAVRVLGPCRRDMGAAVPVAAWPCQWRPGRASGGLPRARVTATRAQSRRGPVTGPVGGMDTARVGTWVTPGVGPRHVTRVFWHFFFWLP